LPLGAAEIDVRNGGTPEIPVVKTALTTVIPSAGTLQAIPLIQGELPIITPAVAPQLDPSQSPEINPAAVTPTPLEQGLGLKNDSPLAPALAPVSQEFSAPTPGQDAGTGKEAADEDWKARIGERPLNIVLAAAESVPLIKTGGLADVIDAIGRGFAARGHNVTLFLPKHAQIKTGGLQFQKLLDKVTVPVAGRQETAQLWQAEHQGVRVILIENDGFFKRDAPYGGYYGDFPDSDERFIFFSRAILESAKVLGLKPDIIHAHDWHAALVAPMLKLLYPNDQALAGAKAVVTLHNMAFQGNFGPESLEKAGFSQENFTADALEHNGRFNFLKGGLQYADALTTVSPTYAKEIQNDPKFGMGLEKILKGRSADLHGVLNGVDQQLWDPETDAVLGRNYGPQDVGLGKAANKKSLQANTGLAIDPNAPLFGVAARLTNQKGLDLVAQIAPKLVELGGQLVIVGVGEKSLEDGFKDLAKRYPRSIFLHPVFDELFPRRIFAASDFLFMPSRFEPCGLSQLMAQRYGSLPIVTKTGGLADTVTDVRDDPFRGDGLFVKEFSAEALTDTVRAAIAHYRNARALELSRHSAMMKDSSWDPAVESYLSLFHSLKDAPPTPAATPGAKTGVFARTAEWLRQLNKSLDSRSKAEQWFWYALWSSLIGAVTFPAIYGMTSIVFPLISIIAAGIIPALALFGLSGGRLVGFLRGARVAPGPRPVGRWKRAALIGLLAGVTLGAAPFAFRAPLVETGARIVAPSQQIRRIPGTAMQDEVVRRLSSNPVGRQILDGLRDRSGTLHLPDFYISKQRDSVAAEHVVVDGIFVDQPNVEGHHWAVDDFLKDPAKQRALVAEMEVTLAHELTHADQARRLPSSAHEAADLFRRHLNFEAEYEAYLNEHLYVYEQLKENPHADISSEGMGSFLGAIGDLDGFLKGIDGSYPQNRHITTAYYTDYFARLHAQWPAHTVDCNMLLAKRALPSMPRVAAMYLEKAQAAAQKAGLPLPQLDIPAPLLAGAAAK
jgi:starch synthase